MTRRGLLGRLLLLLAGMALGCVMAELMARVVAPAANADLLFNSPDASPIGLYVLDPEVLMVPAPNFSAEIRSLGYRIPLRTNSLGLRGPEATKGGWLALGDSFTMSVQVREEETFAQLLATALGQPVHNAGTDGYSTWQALGRYRQLDKALDVDHVLLTFFLGNDFQDNDRFPHILRQSTQLNKGAPIPRQQLPKLESLLLRHSFLYAHWRIWNRQRGIQSGADPQRQGWLDELSIFSREGHGRLSQLQAGTLRALRDLRDEVRRRGDSLWVAIAPPAFQIVPERMEATFSVVGLDSTQADLDAPARAVQKILTQLGIRACDLVAPLQEASQGDEPLYFTFDGHWTPAGHRVVADTIEACVGRRR
jgi:hypothetical protein